MSIIRSGLRRSLSILDSKRVIPALQRQLRRARQARILNIRPKPQLLLLWRLRLLSLGLGLAPARPHRISLRQNRRSKSRRKQREMNKIQASRSSGQTNSPAKDFAFKPL